MRTMLPELILIIGLIPLACEGMLIASQMRADIEVGRRRR